MAEMTPRERLLAAFGRQPCDRVPFAPILEGYFHAPRPEMKHLRSADLQFSLAGHVVSRFPVLRVNTPLWLGAFGAKNPPPGVEETITTDRGETVHPGGYACG